MAAVASPVEVGIESWGESGAGATPNAFTLVRLRGSAVCLCHQVSEATVCGCHAAVSQFSQSVQSGMIPFPYRAVSTDWISIPMIDSSSCSLVSTGSNPRRIQMICFSNGIIAYAPGGTAHLAHQHATAIGADALTATIYMLHRQQSTSVRVPIPPEVRAPYVACCISPLTTCFDHWSTECTPTLTAPRPADHQRTGKGCFLLRLRTTW
jgi:hypothetical protein